MGHASRTRIWAALAALSLLLFTTDPRHVEAGSLRKGTPAVDSGFGKSLRLSLKISGAKKRSHRVSFYKSVARQANMRTIGNPPSGR